MGKKSKSRLTPKEWLIAISVVIVFFLFVKSSDIILNYPLGIWFYPSLIIAAFAFLLKIKQLKTESLVLKSFIEKAMLFGWYPIQAMVLSLLVVGIILLPFNYYNIQYSSKNDYKVYNCKITGVTSGTTHSVYFDFKNKVNYIKASGPELDTIYQTRQYDRYTLMITVKDALLGTSVLYSWKITHE